MRINVLIGIIIILLTSCKPATLHLKEETPYKAKTPDIPKIVNSFRKVADQVFNIYMKDTSRIELYLQLSPSEASLKVKNFDSIPQSEYAAFNLIRNKKEQVIYISEFPVTESDEYDMIYENYFDSKGNLICFVRKCVFFNGLCAKEVHEKSEYYYNEKHKLILKTYEITNEDKKPIDHATCIFNHRYEYKIYKTVNEYIKARNFQLGYLKQYSLNVK